MPIASWGTKQFEVNSETLKTFSDFSNSVSLKTEVQIVENQKFLSSVKNIDPEKLSFTVKLPAQYVDIKQEITSWKALLAAGIAYPLYIGTSQYGTLPYLLKSLSVNKLSIGPSGLFLYAELKLDFEEFCEKIVTQNTPTGKKKPASETRNPTSLPDNFFDPTVYDPWGYPQPPTIVRTAGGGDFSGLVGSSRSWDLDIADVAVMGSLAGIMAATEK